MYSCLRRMFISSMVDSLPKPHVPTTARNELQNHDQPCVLKHSLAIPCKFNLSYNILWADTLRSDKRAVIDSQLFWWLETRRSENQEVLRWERKDRLCLEPLLPTWCRDRYQFIKEIYYVAWRWSWDASWNRNAFLTMLQRCALSQERESWK